MRWTQEADDRLAILRAEGKTSGEIATVMGVSRNAIIGRLHRLRVPSPHPAGPVVDPNKPKRSHKKKPGKFTLDSAPKLHAGFSVSVEAVPPPALMDPGLGIPFMALKFHHCREVIGKEPGGLAIFCGAPKVPYPIQYPYGSVRSSYCAYHAKINYKSS